MNSLLFVVRQLYAMFAQCSRGKVVNFSTQSRSSDQCYLYMSRGNRESNDLTIEVIFVIKLICNSFVQVTSLVDLFDPCYTYEWNNSTRKIIIIIII